MQFDIAFKYDFVEIVSEGVLHKASSRRLYHILIASRRHLIIDSSMLDGGLGHIERAPAARLDGTPRGPSFPAEALQLDELEFHVGLLLPSRPCGVGDARSVLPIDKKTPRLVADFSLNDDNECLSPRIRLQ